MIGDPNEDTGDWPVEWMPYAVEALLYRKTEPVGTVLPSSVCHYCGAKATTQDHIVPRALLPKPMSAVPYWFRSNDVVAACFTCNGQKAAYRSDCTCDHCEWAWKTAWACFIPPETPIPLVVRVVRSPG